MVGTSLPCTAQNIGTWQGRVGVLSHFSGPGPFLIDGRQTSLTAQRSWTREVATEGLGAMSGMGKTLQEARRRRGLTLDQVERETRIRKRYLLSLEQEEYEGLP